MKYYFEGFALDSHKRILLRDGENVHVEPQVFALLVLLIENHTRPVSKDEIHREIWQGRIISDAAVNSRIRSARNAIGDDGRAQRLIKTLHNRGFQFIGELEARDETAGSEVTSGPLHPEGANPDEASSDHTSSGTSDDTLMPDVAMVSTPKFMNRQWMYASIVIAVALIAGVFLITQSPISDPKDDPDGNVAALNNVTSIAVLPFQDMSENEDQAYLGDGLAEELLNILARVDGLKVTSRTSAFGFREKQDSIVDIAAALGVSHVLEGSVRKSGDEIRITAQLIDATTDKHIWSEVYTRQLTAENLFNIQDDIALNISSEISTRLAVEELADYRHTDSLEAYDAYLRAKMQLNYGTIIGISSAIDALNEAIKLDPGFVPPYAVLVEAYRLSDLVQIRPRTKVRQLMKETVDRGMVIAPNSAEMLTASGMLALFDSRLDEALVFFNNALSVDPSHVAAYSFKGNTLTELGQASDAIAAYEAALNYDPLSSSLLSNITYQKLALGDLQGAHAVATKNIQHHPNAPSALHSMAVLARYSGDYAKAHQLLRDAAAVNPNHFYVQADLAFLLNDVGLVDEAITASTETGTKALIHALNGRADKAIPLALEATENYFAEIALYVSGQYSLPYPNIRTELSLFDWANADTINPANYLQIAEYAFILQQNDDQEAANRLINRLQKETADLEPGSIDIPQQILGVAALNILNRNPDIAIEWLNTLHDKKHAFLSLKERPIFHSLVDHQGFAEFEEQTRVNADNHLQEIKAQL